MRLVLARLVEQSIVDAQKAGRAILYSLNRDHLAAQAVLMLTDQRGELHRRISADMDTWTAAPVYAALFGSASRNDMRIDSNVDVFRLRDLVIGNVAEDLNELRNVLAGFIGFSDALPSARTTSCPPPRTSRRTGSR